MQEVNLDRQWLFSMPFTQKFRRPEAVDLPHDFSLIQQRVPASPGGPGNGYFPGGLGVYEKTFSVPAAWQGKKILLEFEGVYMNCTVRLNNQLVGRHPYGYTSFHCDLTPHLRYGTDNTVKVQVNNVCLPNSRWYSGSGIYRRVRLLLGEPVHIPPWGIYVTTPEVSPESSVVKVETTINNAAETAMMVTVRSTLLNSQKESVSVKESAVRVAGKSEETSRQELVVSPAALWSVDHPYLYTLRSELVKEGVVIDTVVTKIGIRALSFDATNGFQLNGVPMKLKGGCVHHDCGLLGSAAYDRAEERKVELLKKNGFNAVRCAHNPPSPAFLDACDRRGMLVIDEAFDCWNEEKNPGDYALVFAEWWQRDLAAMVLRDRNHPSIIMWSTGNEIIERDGRSEGYRYARELAGFIRKLDNTRPVNNAVCTLWYDPSTHPPAAHWPKDANTDYWGKLTEEFIAPLDVAGYNYLLERYEKDGEKYPNRIICGTESYPLKAFDYWEATERLPHVIGDFVWTALDYLGEAGLGRVRLGKDREFHGPYPHHTAFCGDMDICGFKRPQSYYRDCIWGTATAPYIAVHNPGLHGVEVDITRWGWPDVSSSWTWPGYEGKPVVVDVYSRDEEVELFLNGKSHGRKPAGKAAGYIATFELEYQPGELAVVGYGPRESRAALKTAGAPATIRLTPDRPRLKAEYGDLSFVTVELLDSAGNLVTNAGNKLYFTACGVGNLQAVGNGDPRSEEMYVGNERRVYQGRAMAVVKANGEPGEILLSAGAEGLPPATLVITVLS